VICGVIFLCLEGGNCWLFREDKQKEDYGMFFSGLDLAQPAKTRQTNIRTGDQDYQSPLKMIWGVIFPFYRLIAG
jgi:hypothetical protein